MRERCAKDRAGRQATLFALVLALGLAPGIARAVLTSGLEAQGWRELPNPHKSENHFSLAPDGAIEVASEDSVSTLYRPANVDLAKRPILSWRWRVDQAAPATDLSAKGEDDCSLAVYVGFPYGPERASFVERMKRKLVEAWAGENAPGRVLRYVFCGEGARGEMVESPYLGDAGMIKVLRPASAPTGQWFQEQVDVVADYRKAFGEKPESRAEVEGLAFVARDGANAHSQ
jgi:hypothetical protein